MHVLGVDGAPGGWVGAAWDGRRLHLEHRRTVAELFAAAGGPETVGVDIPIGLPERDPRRADTTARAFLERRRSTVFPAPPAALLARGDFADHAAGNALAREVTGSGLSRQAFGLLPRIDEVERWRHTVRAAVREVHPEVSFQVLAGRPLRAGKKTWTGTGERRRLLAVAGLHPDEDADAGPAGVDDVLAAVAVAWTAWRIATGRAVTFPSDPAPDEPAIWA